MIADNPSFTFSQSVRFWWFRFWKFSRPHTIIGTSLSVLALFLIALSTQNSVLLNWELLFGTLIACLCGNIYIVGLNQLEDIAIDKINKPHLPLASGEFSLKQGQWIVGITGILALTFAAALGQWLFLTVIVSLAIGTAYSLPPFRLKQFPFLAALCIFTVRGVIVNLGLFLHFNQGLTGKAQLTPVVWLLTLFILIFTVAIAIFKDVPDMEGDRQYNITTFTLLLGKSTIFHLTQWIVTFCYLGIITAGIFHLPGINSWLLIWFHIGLLSLLWWRSRQINLDEKTSIASFYQFIWKLFFLEYLLFPLACFFT